jgi:hypothetical protein
MPAFNAPELSIGQFFYPGVATATTIYAGEMVALNAAGYAVPASDTANLRVIGRAEEDVVNAGADGAAKIKVKRGVFKWDNDVTNPVTIASVGLPCYVKTSTSVAVAAGPANDIKAGLVFRVDSDGVWVDTALAPAI